MAPPGAESKTTISSWWRSRRRGGPRKWHRLHGTNGSPFTPITGEDDTSRASSPFLERGAADTLTALRTSPDITLLTMVNTNPLDEQQQQIVASEESAKHRSATMSRLAGQRDYVFRAPSFEERLSEVTGRFLSGGSLGLRPPRLAISLRERLSANGVYSRGL